MIRPLSALVLLALLLAAPALADEVQLRNGDRLTGTVVTLANGTLTFSTPYGNVRVPWTDVTSLIVAEPILVTIGGKTALQPGGTIALAQVTALERRRPAFVIDGGANAGLITTAGNTDVNNLRMDGDVVARGGENRYSASAAVTRAQDRGVETARSWSTALKYDRFLSERLFVNGNAILTSDRFRDLDLRSAIGAGIGYQVLATPVVTLTADAGLGYVNENLASQPDDSYTAFRESATLRVAVVRDRVQVFHQHDGYFGVTGDDNLFMRMQNGVSIALAGGFVTTLRHDLDYDRSPAPGRRSTDRTLALTLGYRF